MYCVGLTGNIASGKSTVGCFFKARGIAIISADEVARELTMVNEPALLAIEKHFGQSIINSVGQLNRSMLRQLIITNQEQRLWLEQLLHPLIRQAIQNKIKEATGPYSMIEIPLLNKRSDYPLDRVLLIIAGKKQQIARIIERDKNTEKQAQTILALQTDEAIRRKFADDIVNNNGSIIELEKKIENLHHQYLQFASQKSS